MTAFTGTTGNDVFDNSAVSTDDVFTTLAGDDSINAGGGNDTVDAGVGHDTANGGAGTDVLKVNWASSAWGISYQVIPAVGNAVVLTYSSSYQAIADTLALSGSAISLTTQDGVNTLSYTGMEQYQLQGSDLWGDAWYNSSLSADLLIYQGTGGSYRGGGADGYTYYGVYDTFYANWSSTTTAITWVNDPSGLDQTVNGVIVSGVERLLISTGSGNDTLNNTAVNTDDVFISGAGADSISAGGGNDSVDSGDGNDSVLAGTGDDTVLGGLGDDTLDGGAGSDSINAGGGNDTLLDINPIDGGDDTVDGGIGFDTLNVDWSSSATGINYLAVAGDGSETELSYNSSYTAIRDAIAGARLELWTRDGSHALRVSNVERYNLQGSNVAEYAYSSDLLIFQGSGGSYKGGNAAEYTAGSGYDTFYADWGSTATAIQWVNYPSGVSQLVNGATITGVERLLLKTGSGADVLDNTSVSTDDVFITGAGNDSVNAGGGDDFVDSGTGNDTLNGGAGIDTLGYDSATGSVTVNLSTGVATGANGTDTLSGFENIVGSAYGDTLTGDANANVLDGGAGVDTLSGGAGDDTYVVDVAGDVIVEGSDAGIDTVVSTISYVLAANLENLTLSGSGNIDGTGNNLDNLIIANAGDNVIDGSTGTDTVSYANAGSGLTLNLGLTSAQATGGSGSDTLLNIENLIGSVYDDNLTGSAGNNQLKGGDGNDTLDGAAGADTLTGGNGSDVYVVDNAADVVVETEVDSFVGGSDLVLSQLTAYTLADNVEQGTIMLTGAANLTGNDLDNLLTAAAGNNVLSGGAGNDTVSYANATSAVTVSLAVTTAQATGGSGSDTLIDIEDLIGSAYNDTLSGSDSGNTFDGGAGTDTVSYAGAGGGVSVSLAIVGAQATGSSGLDTLIGIENLSGSSWDDALTGDGNSNTLMGGAGADSLDGGAGADSLVGGDGSDTYYIDDASDVVSETNADSVSGGVDTVYSSLSAYTLGSSVENGIITSAGAANLTGNELSNVLTAGAGNNILDGGLGLDTVSYAGAGSAVTVNLSVSTAQATGGSGSDTLVGIENVEGSGYNDTLTGSAGSNVLIGGVGADVLDGKAGADTLIGGWGNDVYVVDDAGDVVQESESDQGIGGVDQVYSNLGAYTLGANVENGVINVTGAGNLTGNELDNLLYAGGGDNVINGGLGLDRVSYSRATGGVTVSLGVTTAQATGGSGSDTLVNIENLVGSNYDDVLSGSGGDNVISGGTGNDTLTGNAGRDTLAGGAGNDVFDFNALADLGLGSTARDIITDFTAGQDLIDLSGIDADALLAGDQAFTLVTSFTTAGGEISYSNGILYFNTDNDTAAEYEIQLTGTIPASLTAANFIL